MTGRERIQAAFAFQPTDRVPIFEQTVASRVASEAFGRPLDSARAICATKRRLPRLPVNRPTVSSWPGCLMTSRGCTGRWAST